MEVKQGEPLCIATTVTPTTSQVHDEEEEPCPPKMLSLQDLYDSTDEVHLICLLADSKNIAFEEAIRDKKWKITMDEEIKAIEKNYT